MASFLVSGRNSRKPVARPISAQPPQSHFRSPAASCERREALPRSDHIAPFSDHLLASRINGHVSKHLNMEEVEEDLRPREGDLMKAAPFALPAKNRAERIVPFYRELRCSD